jgi:hypothetical protein
MISKMLHFLIHRYAKKELWREYEFSPMAGKIFPMPERVVEHIRKSCNFKSKQMFMGWRLK